MFVKFINANERLRGKPLLVNKNSLNSVYELEKDGTTVTVLCTPDERISWAVLDSIDDVLTKLNGA